MVIDERQLVVDGIMATLPDLIRYDRNATISGITKREQIQWIRRNPAPGENRSLINNTDFKVPSWAGKVIRLVRPKRGRRR